LHGSGTVKDIVDDLAVVPQDQDQVFLVADKCISFDSERLEWCNHRRFRACTDSQGPNAAGRDFLVIQDAVVFDDTGRSTQDYDTPLEIVGRPDPGNGVAFRDECQSQRAGIKVRMSVIARE
jgi:hypothetical protein